MRMSNDKLISETIELVDGVNMVLTRTVAETQLSAKDCYDLAYKLEQALNSLLTVGNRKRQEDINSGVRSVS